MKSVPRFVSGYNAPAGSSLAGGIKEETRLEDETGRDNFFDEAAFAMKRQSILVVLMVASLLAGALVFSPRVAWSQEASPWKDRAEYDAFNAMAQATDPNQRIQLAEKYLGDYPETKFRDKVYEFQLQAYQQLNNTQKVEETAGKLLEVNANHFPALYMLSYLIPRTVQGEGPETDSKLVFERADTRP